MSPQMLNKDINIISYSFIKIYKFRIYIIDKCIFRHQVKQYSSSSKKGLYIIIIFLRFKLINHG